MIEKYNMLQ